jgi:hypothetical protein
MPAQIETNGRLPVLKNDAGSDHEDGETRHEYDDAGDQIAGQLEEQLVGSLMLGIVHCRVPFGSVDAHSTPLLTPGLLLSPATYHKALKGRNV